MKARGSIVTMWLGEPDRAVECFARAMRLSPIDPHAFMMKQGMAHAHATQWSHSRERQGIPPPHVCHLVGAKGED